MIKVSPSMLSANFIKLYEDIDTLEAAGADMLHIDVMDGNFVPNLSFGLAEVKAIKNYSKIPLDVHLMIDKPHRYIKAFSQVADILGFHYEAGSNVEETLKEIRGLGCRSCLTIKPCTEPEEIYEFLPLCDMVLVMSVEPGFGGQKFISSALLKLEKLRKEIDRLGLDIDLEVDGGINDETAPLALKSGANILVAGSYIFSAQDISLVINEMKNIK